MHILAFIWHHGDYAQGLVVDHKNGDTHDNSPENLRLATHAENMRNRKVARHSKTGVKGVARHGGGFRARITHAGVVHTSPTFETVDEAGAFYITKSKELHGQFARL